MKKLPTKSIKIEELMAIELQRLTFRVMRVTME